MLVELIDLNKKYTTPAGSQVVLKGINLSIMAGEYIALMGPSGSGKSTLMNIIGCLDLPTTGKYFLNGKDVSSLNENQQAHIRNCTIGFIFQGFNLLPRMTLENNIVLPMVYAGLDKTTRLNRAQILLEKVGLGHRLSAMPNEISGGEQQRVAIARALANYPKLILADEPTGNLDSENSNIIMDMFTSLNKEGTTIFMVTHEADVASYAKRQLKLFDGKVVFDKINSGKFSD
jgi:putative ABC transport system ATP-binding protein